MALCDYLKRTRRLRKILILGSGTVGKSSLLKVLKENKSLSEMDPSYRKYKRTPFLELDTIDVSRMKNNTNGVFQLYDVAGQLDMPIHAIRDFANTILNNTDLVILMFASDNPQSLYDLNKWIRLVEKYYKKFSRIKKPYYLLLRNKIDLNGSLDPILSLKFRDKDKRIIEYFEISCLTYEGISKLKEWLINYLFLMGKINLT